MRLLWEWERFMFGEVTHALVATVESVPYLYSNSNIDNVIKEWIEFINHCYYATQVIRPEGYASVI